MEAGQRYAKLLNIAKESSSERRRELLHEVTDLFFDNADNVSPVEQHMFGELMGKVAFDLDVEVRKELSSRFIEGHAPRNLALKLANDEIDVAAPILRNTKSLTDDDLINIVETKGTHYQIAVSQREIVSETVSDALVNHGNDDVLTSLLRNEGAKIADHTFDKVVERAEANPDLHRPMLSRQAIPPEVLNQLYLVVSGPMRKEILERNSHLSQAEVEAAMSRAQARIGVKVGALPEDYEAANRKVLALKASGQLDAAQLPNIWRNGDATLFKLAFANIVGVDYLTIDKMLINKDADGMALICRAKSFPRALFVTIAALTLGNQGMAEAEVLGNMYNDVSIEDAGRALRFMQVRNAAAKAA